MFHAYLYKKEGLLETRQHGRGGEGGGQQKAQNIYPPLFTHAHVGRVDTVDTRHERLQPTPQRGRTWCDAARFL